jgi:hypothetical protein
VGLHNALSLLCCPWHATHNALLLSAVLLTADARAKVGDVGLARFMAADYMSAQAALGTFSWTVRRTSFPHVGCEWLQTCLLTFDNDGVSNLEWYMNHVVWT